MITRIGFFAALSCLFTLASSADEPPTPHSAPPLSSLKKLVEEYELPCRVLDSAPWQDNDLCGVNCAFGMLLLTGQSSNYTALRSSAGSIPKGGLSLEEIRQLLRQFELDTEVLRGSLDQLCVLGAPAIVHVGSAADSGHYLLCISANSDRIEFLDGTTGALLSVGEGGPIDRAAFAREMTGYFIVPQAALGEDAGDNWLSTTLLVFAIGIWGYVVVLLPQAFRWRRHVH